MFKNLVLGIARAGCFYNSTEVNCIHNRGGFVIKNTTNTYLAYAFSRGQKIPALAFGWQEVRRSTKRPTLSPFIIANKIYIVKYNRGKVVV